MAGELVRHMLSGGGVAGEIAEHAAALIEARVGIGLANDRLRSRLMHARIESELAAAHRILRRQSNAPAGDDLGEGRDIVLGVDRAHPERMQLENLAREILVQTATAILAGLRGRTNRAC